MTRGLVLILLLGGCAAQALPARPDLVFHAPPQPMMVLDRDAPPVRVGERLVRRNKAYQIPAGHCLTEPDHLALLEYLDAIDSARGPGH